MLYLLLSITEFATKLVSALSGIVLAIIILVIIVTAKNKKSKEPLVPAKAKNVQNADADCKDKKKKKSKKGNDKTGIDSENSHGAANESNANSDATIADNATDKASDNAQSAGAQQK